MKKKKWSKYEVEILKKIYRHFLMGEITKEEMESIFNRSLQSIKCKASYLRISDQDISIINEKVYKNVLKRIQI